MDKKSLFKNDIWTSTRAAIFYIGVLIIVLSHLIIPISNGLTFSKWPQVGKSLTDFSHWLSENGMLTGGTLIVTSLLLMLGRVAFDQFWANKVKPFLDDHIATLERELQETRIETKLLLSKQMLEAAVSRSKPEEIKNNLKFIHTEAFGSHCSSDNGLYHAMNKSVAKYLDPTIPHRSHHHQEITIEEHQGTKVHWIEDTHFQLHVVALDADYSDNAIQITSAPYSLNFSTSADYVDFEKLALSICIDDQELIRLKNGELHLRDQNGTLVKADLHNNDVLKLTDDSDWNQKRISIKKEITLTKAYTNVTVHEESFFTENYYYTNRVEPVCESKITITLPESWGFVFFTTPKHADWITTQHRSYKWSASNRGWAMPGLALACAWEKGVST